MAITIVPCRSDNYCYIVELENSKAILIDASDSTPILEELEDRGLNLVAILLTHEHSDHIAGLKEIKAQHQNSLVFAYPGVAAADKNLEDGKNLLIEEAEIEVIHTPGHSEFCTSFYFPKLKSLFTGDCLFAIGCGRVFTGNYEQMFKSLNRLKLFPDETQIYCGHDYLLKNLQFAASLDPKDEVVQDALAQAMQIAEAGAPSVPSYIDQEKDFNPFLRAKSLEDFKQLRDMRDSF